MDYDGFREWKFKNLNLWNQAFILKRNSSHIGYQDQAFKINDT